MITSRIIKKKFELYRKWFYTFLATEFLNLPVKEQEKFLIISKKFLQNCERVHEEAKNIIEKIFSIHIKKIESFNNKGENCIVIGEIMEINERVKISLPITYIPKIGESIDCVLFSLDKKSWYASKEALITGR